MPDLLVRFVVGGAIVSIFSAFGDVFRPKSFAGLFGAAPSVALATLSLTISREGVVYAATECHAMVAGAIALLIYSVCVCHLLMKWRIGAFRATIGAFAVWVIAVAAFSKVVG